MFFFSVSECPLWSAILCSSPLYWSACRLDHGGYTTYRMNMWCNVLITSSFLLSPITFFVQTAHIQLQGNQSSGRSIFAMYGILHRKRVMRQEGTARTSIIIWSLGTTVSTYLPRLWDRSRSHVMVHWWARRWFAWSTVIKSWCRFRRHQIVVKLIRPRVLTFCHVVVDLFKQPKIVTSNLISSNTSWRACLSTEQWTVKATF